MDNSTEKVALLALFRMMLRAAGEQAKSLKKTVWLGVLTAVLRGLAFLGFIPLFMAVNQRDWVSLWGWLIAMIVLLLISSVSDWRSRDHDYAGHSAQAGDALRRQLGEHLRRIPLQDLYRRRTGELSAAIAGDVDDVINYSMMVILMFLNAVVVPMVVGLGALFFDVRLGVALLLIFPAILPIYFWVLPLVTRHKKELVEANAVLYAETLEYTQGLPVLKSAQCVGEKSTRFNLAAEKVAHVQLQAMQKEAPANVLLGSVVEIGMMLIVAMGLYLVSHGDITLWLLAALMVAIIRFAEPLSTVISMMGVFEMVNVGYHRLEKLLAIKPLLLQPPSQQPHQFDISIEGLSFYYEGSEEPALKEINLTLPPHALTALVGTSGCGKTTLVRMLMRYADPQSGIVRMGGIDIKSIGTEQLHQLIAVVFQDVYLFDESILENIRMGRSNASDEEVHEAAKAAHCHDFISRFPDGYHTKVGDIGGRLSGGERQRISIARALLKNAPIVILDEPTAALDTHSELAVQAAIDALVREKTVIVIAHRLSTIVGAQQIVVMDKSEVVEVGTHELLLGKKGRYAALWRAQQSTVTI